jgi:3-oxoacyl-[acyl-carrier-protein] synthase II|tara:strand:+ start:854 stop:2122 length:1269 start_codon:yes stop_codon:yes gene_type:complete
MWKVSKDIRVVVTGMGLITPLGVGLQENWDALMTGKSGIGPVTRFNSERLPSQISGEVKDFNPEDYIERKEIKKMDTFIQFVLAATKMAFDDAGLKKPEEDIAPRYGAVIGVGLGGLPAIEKHKDILEEKGPKRLSPFFIPMLLANLAAGQVSMRWGLKGPNTCTVTACASSNHAIGDAMKFIQRGIADVMVSGGGESCITELAMGGFCAMKALSTWNEDPERASRPFDADRNGFVMGEGSGVLILERYEHAAERGAKIYAEVSGYGLSADAYHITSPSPDGEGAARSMEMAMQDAGISIDDVHYINAHGTSTPGGDKLETVAIKRTFGEKAYNIPVSSTKSMTGHLLGAAGGIESIFTILSIQNGTVPPTINQDTPDPECDLDYVPNQPRKADIRCAITNSFGFGGTNASILFRKPEAEVA